MHVDYDEIEHLGDEIAELSAHLEAATVRLLDRIREFDERAGWNNGFRSCAEWLSWRVGLDRGAARERVRVARALGSLSLLRDALARGEISYAKVRAARVATPETQERLLAVARAGTADHVEQIVRGWRRVDRNAERDDARRQYATRGLYVSPSDDGTETRQGASSRSARARTIPSALRRALQRRDKRCRFPGCNVRFTEGHHIRHWAQGGPTTLSNLALLCRRHHRAVHEEGFRLERKPDGALVFYRPNGWVLPHVPISPAVPIDPLGQIQKANGESGLRIDPQTLKPLWTGEPFDLGWAIDVLHPRANPLTDRPAPRPADDPMTRRAKTSPSRSDDPLAA